MDDTSTYELLLIAATLLLVAAGVYQVSRKAWVGMLVVFAAACVTLAFAAAP